jgi:hypothetical protein
MLDVELRDALARHAHTLDERAPAITVDELVVRPVSVARRTPRRTGTRVALALALVVAIVVAVAVFRGTPDATPVRPAGPNAKRISDYHWSEIPAPPYPTRVGTATVWTGRRLLEWGGQFLGPDLVTPDIGTAFDAASGTWRMLPASPLAGRFEASSVWTGHEMLVWGGTNGATLSTVFADGAAFDPTSDTWRALPPSPLAARAAAQAVWTGHEMIVVGGQRVVVGVAVPALLDAAAYDPARNRWRVLPALPTRAGHDVHSTTTLWIGDRLLVWEQWTTSDASGASNGAGIDLVTYRPGEARWHWLPATRGPVAIDHPVWTGREVIVPPTSLPTVDPTFVGGANGAWRYEPRSNRWSRLPAGPMDDVAATAVWTGRAVVFLDASAFLIVGPDGSSPPGKSAVFDPRADRWYRAADPPFRSVDEGTPLVWTGRELLAPGAVPVPTLKPALAGAAFGGLRLGP